MHGRMGEYSKYLRHATYIQVRKIQVHKQITVKVIRVISKKIGVAHAEASFLGGREKQNGLVDVQWEKGVKK